MIEESREQSISSGRSRGHFGRYGATRRNNGEAEIPQGHHLNLVHSGSRGFVLLLAPNLSFIPVRDFFIQKVYKLENSGS